MILQDKERYEVAIIVGTRAELIKVFPVMLELKLKEIPYYFIHTGQHNLKNLCKEFKVKEPDKILSEEPKKSSRFNSKKIKAILWNIGLITKIKRELKSLKNLKYLIYHGDTMTTATASLASSRLFNFSKKYKSIHLESGLRSWSYKEPFPEELFRIIASNFSNILLTPSKESALNLTKLKKKEVIITGNTVLDSVDEAIKIANKRKIRKLSEEKFGLVTIHRHENINNKKNMQKIIEILEESPINLYFAIHDNTIHKLRKYNLLSKLENSKNIRLIKPMDYVSFIYQYSQASLIICDGGSMQEESLILKKPCIILRNRTERPEGLKTNFQFLSKLDKEKTKEKIKEFTSSNFKIKSFVNPYGKVGLSKKIVKIIEDKLKNESRH